MRLPAYLAGACLLLASAGAAPAAPVKFEPVPVDRVIATFKGICLDHIGDPQAQIATGLAAPYGMQPYTGPAKVPPGVYLIDSVQVMISTDIKSCMVTSMIDDRQTLDQVVAAASDFAPRDKAQPGETPDTLMWLRTTPFGANYGMGIKVSKGDSTVTTIGIMDLGDKK